MAERGISCLNRRELIKVGCAVLISGGVKEQKQVEVEVTPLSNNSYKVVLEHVTSFDAKKFMLLVGRMFDEYLLMHVTGDRIDSGWKVTCIFEKTELPSSIYQKGEHRLLP